MGSSLARGARTAGIVVLLWAAVGSPQPAIVVSHVARAVAPGEIVVIEVGSESPLAAVGATAFGASLRFYVDDTGGVWRALLGIDLETVPGEVTVRVRATTVLGEVVEVPYGLTVTGKDFPTRHLSVAPSFVNPPAEVIERIQREAALQAEIFSTATAERQWRGGFLRPVPGASTSSFGRRSVYNGEPRSPHSGTDFRASAGTPVVAPNQGTVVLAGDLYFSGNVVIVDHGWGLYSFFAHLSEIHVSAGERVASGQVVGRVGATGRVTGPHLHWTVRLNNARVDPLSLITLFPAD